MAAVGLICKSTVVDEVPSTSAGGEPRASKARITNKHKQVTTIADRNQRIPTGTSRTVIS